MILFKANINSRDAGRAGFSIWNSGNNATTKRKKRAGRKVRSLIKKIVVLKFIIRNTRISAIVKERITEGKCPLPSSLRRRVYRGICISLPPF
jgi:hypothetical protein